MDNLALSYLIFTILNRAYQSWNCLGHEFGFVGFNGRYYWGGFAKNRFRNLLL